MLARTRLVGLFTAGLLLACGPGGTPDAGDGSSPPADQQTPPPDRVDTDATDDRPLAMDAPSPTDTPSPTDAPEDVAAPPDAGDGATAPTWTSIYSEIIQARCTPCHTTEMRGSLAMSNAATAYTNLVGARAMGPQCGSSGMTRVVAGDAEMSLLFRKINPSPPCGSRMPTSGGFLSDAQVDRIRDWINAGARND